MEGGGAGGGGGGAAGGRCHHRSASGSECPEERGVGSERVSVSRRLDKTRRGDTKKKKKMNCVMTSAVS